MQRNDLQYEIRRMRQEDIAAAVAVEEQCFADPWTETAYRGTLLLPFAHYYVAESRQEGILGIIGLELVAGEGEISNVAVLPRYRRRGIGHALMEQVLTDGRQNGSHAFTLEVREGNTTALALYESFGFRVEGRRRHYYDRPTEDALILWLRENPAGGPVSDGKGTGGTGSLGDV